MTNQSSLIVELIELHQEQTHYNDGVMTSRYGCMTCEVDFKTKYSHRAHLIGLVAGLLEHPVPPEAKAKTKTDESDSLFSPIQKILDDAAVEQAVNKVVRWLRTL